MRRYYLLAILFFCHSLVWTQTHRCGSDAYHNQQLENKDFQKSFKETQAHFYDRFAENKGAGCSDPILIPIAVHFSGNINASNPQCLINKCFEQIEVMNADFAAYNVEINNYLEATENCPVQYPAEALSSGSCIQFYLASQGHPSCESSSNLISGLAITVGQHQWPSAPCWAGYLNIFVEDDLPHLGLAPLFGGASPNGNGIQIASGAFGGLGGTCDSGVALDNQIPYHLGRTGSHEAGHYFGLYHVFEGCGNADQILDTPDQSIDNAGKPQIDFASCGSNANNSCGTEDFFFNFMDYVDDSSMWMFSDDQCKLMEMTAGSGNFLENKGAPILRSRYTFEFRDVDGNVISPPNNTDLRLFWSTNETTLDLDGFFINNGFTYPSPYIPPLTDLSVSFENNTMLTKDLSALDLILIQKHALAVTPFTNPFHVLASDINGSNTVSALDLIELQKVILLQNNNFSGKNSYSFLFESCNNCENLTLPPPTGDLINVVVTVLKNGNVN